MIPTEVQAIIFDFDGVFTDNYVIINEEGQESVRCNRSDGLGISRIKKLGISILVLSSETNPVVRKRCDKLGIPCLQGIENKKKVLSNWLKEQNIHKTNVIYVGNDINDIECLTYVGCGIVVADAHKEAKRVAKIILKKEGGKGAIREICDIILLKSKKL